MEINVGGAVGGLVAEVFAPVSGVNDLGGGAEDGADIRCELEQGCDEGVGAAGGAHLGEATQFRAEHEGVDAAGGFGEHGMMQDHAAETEFGRTGVDDGVAAEREVRGQRSADEMRDGRGGAGGFVGRVGAARGGRNGDAPAPGISGLRGSGGVGIGQRVAGGNIEQDEG